MLEFSTCSQKKLAQSLFSEDRTCLILSQSKVESDRTSEERR